MNLFTLPFKNENMATKKNVLTPIPEQVKDALDGRTQRWLALELKMSENVLSQKMKGLLNFSNEDIEAINKRLSTNIQK